MSWQIEDTRHDAALESVFALGNGYLGVRGAPEEGTPAYDGGMVLNGFYETWPIAYPEDAYGLARTGQTIVAPPDGSIVRLFADGEALDVTAGRVRRVLDMRAGVLHREVEFETASGARLRVRSRRLASLARRNLVAIDYEVTVLDGAAELVLSSELRPHEQAAADDDPRRHKGFAERPLDPVAAETLGPRAVLTMATRRSGLTLACGMHNDFEGARSVTTTVDGDAARVVAAAFVGRAARCGCASTSPTTGPRTRRPATWPLAPTARSTARSVRATRRSSWRTRNGSRRSGRAATSRCAARRRCSAPCASTSSS